METVKVKNDFIDNNAVLSCPSLGMVSRLKYIVSNRARPPSTAGLGYGKTVGIIAGSQNVVKLHLTPKV